MQTLPTTDNELAAWLRLSMAPGLRPGALRAMLNDCSATCETQPPMICPTAAGSTPGAFYMSEFDVEAEVVTFRCETRGVRDHYHRSSRGPSYALMNTQSAISAP